MLIICFSYIFYIEVRNHIDSMGTEIEFSRSDSWKWVCVAGSCIVGMTMSGSSYSFPVIYVVCLEKFSASATATGWLGAIHVGLRLSLGKPFTIVATLSLTLGVQMNMN